MGLQLSWFFKVVLLYTTIVASCILFSFFSISFDLIGRSDLVFSGIWASLSLMLYDKPLDKCIPFSFPFFPCALWFPFLLLHLNEQTMFCSCPYNQNLISQFDYVFQFHSRGQIQTIVWQVNINVGYCLIQNREGKEHWTISLT